MFPTLDHGTLELLYPRPEEGLPTVQRRLEDGLTVGAYQRLFHAAYENPTQSQSTKSIEKVLTRRQSSRTRVYPAA
jgi:hypothetical protein